MLAAAGLGRLGTGPKDGPAETGTRRACVRSGESREGFAPSPAPIAPLPSWSQEVTIYPAPIMCPQHGPGTGDRDPLPAQRGEEPARGPWAPPQWQRPQQAPAPGLGTRHPACQSTFPPGAAVTCSCLSSLHEETVRPPRPKPARQHPLTPRLPCTQQSLPRAGVSGHWGAGVTLGGVLLPSSGGWPPGVNSYTLGARQPVTASQLCYFSMERATDGGRQMGVAACQ